MICFSFTTGHFCACAKLQENIIFHFSSWLSFQRLCRLLRGFVQQSVNISTATERHAGLSVTAELLVETVVDRHKHTDRQAEKQTDGHAARNTLLPTYGKVTRPNDANEDIKFISGVATWRTRPT